MLYRVETGLHANITDTQGRKTALHLLKALQIPVAAIRSKSTPWTVWMPPR